MRYLDTMNTHARRSLALLGIFAALTVMLTGCSDASEPSAASEATPSDGIQLAKASSPAEVKVAAADKVVASIEPLASVVRSMLGDEVDVVTLLPSGLMPQELLVTPAQIMEVSEANLVVTVGPDVDPWAKQAAMAAGGNQTARGTVEILSMAGQLGIFKITPCPNGCVCGEAGHTHDHAHHHGISDVTAVGNYLWLDPVRMKAFVEAMEPKLIEMFPQRQSDITTNTAKLKHELDQLNDDYKFMLDEVPNKKLATFTHAFDLLAERYGLEVVAHLAEIQTHGPSLDDRDIQQIQEVVDRDGLKVLYHGPNLPREVSDAIIAETGVNLMVLDPWGKPGESYGDLMRRNLETLMQGQRE